MAEKVGPIGIVLKIISINNMFISLLFNYFADSPLEISIKIMFQRIYIMYSTDSNGK